MLRRQLTKAELETLWAEYPSLFTHPCSCGAMSYNYSHVVRTREAEPNVVKSSIVSYICPECGCRKHLGANYHFSQLRNRTMNAFLDGEALPASPFD